MNNKNNINSDKEQLKMLKKELGDVLMKYDMLYDGFTGEIKLGVNDTHITFIWRSDKIG